MRLRSCLAQSSSSFEKERKKGKTVVCEPPRKAEEDNTRLVEVIRAASQPQAHKGGPRGHRGGGIPLWKRHSGSHSTWKGAQGHTTATKPQWNNASAVGGDRSLRPFLGHSTARPHTYLSVVESDSEAPTHMLMLSDPGLVWDRERGVGGSGVGRLLRS